MRKTALCMTAAAATLAGCATNKPVVLPAPDPVVAAPAVDVNSPLYAPMFLQMAASTNMFEIQSSQLAHSRAKSPAIHQFASMIIADHQMVGQQMMAAAQAAGVPMPPMTMMPTEQQMLAQLQAAPEGTFDLAYRDAQVAAHQNAVTLFQNYATNGDNPTLRATAAQALPKLQQHLAMAQSLAVTAGPMTTSRPGERG